MMKKDNTANMFPLLLTNSQANTHVSTVLVLRLLRDGFTVATGPILRLAACSAPGAKACHRGQLIPVKFW
jgi:hypothetical protein